MKTSNNNQYLIAQLPDIEAQIIPEFQKAADFGIGIMLTFIGGFLIISLIAWLLHD